VNSFTDPLEICQQNNEPPLLWRFICLRVLMGHFDFSLFLTGLHSCDIPDKILLGLNVVLGGDGDLFHNGGPASVVRTVRHGACGAGKTKVDEG